jgi:hypothetical protein
MNDDNLAELAIELRTKMYFVFQKFWQDKKPSKKDVFTITCTAMSSILAQITWTFFKKPSPKNVTDGFIDGLAEATKIQLEDFLKELKKHEKK